MCSFEHHYKKDEFISSLGEKPKIQGSRFWNFVIVLLFVNWNINQ